MVSQPYRLNNHDGMMVSKDALPGLGYIANQPLSTSTSTILYILVLYLFGEFAWTGQPHSC